ncbi:MAG: putative holin [Bilophila sp.]
MGIFRLLFQPHRQLVFFALLAATLHMFLLLASPVQVPVVLYKLALTMLAAILGVFFDFAVFPFASPQSYLDEDWKKFPAAARPLDADFPIARGYQRAFVGACLRRAGLVAAFALSVSLGL